MELQQQHLLPQGVQLLVGVVRPGPGGRRGRPGLCLDQELLVATVALLGLVLRRQRGPVQLQVELAHPDSAVIRAGREQLPASALEERVRVLPAHLGAALEVREPLGAAGHLAGGAATAVAVADGCDRARGAPRLAELAGRLAELLARELRVVGVHRREVRQHARPVDALPPERVVREDVDLVPGDLLREEPVEPRAADELRQGRRVAERVGQPHPVRTQAELPLEEPLRLRELARQRLTRRHHRVGLDPHAAQRQEPALGHGLLDPLPHLGTVLLDPGVLLRGRHAVDEVVGALDQVGHGRRRARHLADRLAYGPQPGGVDVRVPDGGDLVGAVLGRAGQHVRERRPGPRRGLGDALQVEHVEGVVERLQHAHTARACGQLGLKLQQHLDVEREVVHLGLEDREVDAPGRVQRVRGRRRGVTLGGALEHVVPQEHRVGRRLQEQLDALAAGRGVGHDDVLVAGVDGLHRAAVRPVDQGLGLEAGTVHVEAEVDHGLDGASGPLGGHGARQPEPGGTPGRAPRRAHLVRLHREGEPLGRRDRLPRQGVPLDVERDRRLVHRRPDPFGQDPVRAPGGQCDVVVHRKGLPCFTVERTQANPDSCRRPEGVRWASAPPGG